MKTIAVIGALALTTSTAVAQEPVFFGNVEYQTEAETLEFGLGADFYASERLTITPEMTMQAVDGDFDLEGFDLTAAYAIDEDVYAYGRVEFDADAEYEEFTVGVAFTF